jgi:hypothetical protein
VQNQKQEPHIKMWGKNNQFKQTSNKSDKVKKQQYNQENKTHTINKKKTVPNNSKVPKNSQKLKIRRTKNKPDTNR